jgi:glycosyltransferase involved in cell wall biosynthesis
LECLLSYPKAPETNLDAIALAALPIEHYNARMSVSPAHIALNAQLLCGRASYRSAGIHNYIDHLLKHLPAADPDLRFTVFVGEGQPQMPPDRATVRRTRLPTIRPAARIFWEQWVQPFELIRARPDLVHSLAFVSPFFAPCPAVVTVYDVSFKLFPERFLPAQRLYLSAFTAHSCRRARRVIAISQSTKADLVRVFGLPPEKIDVAYPGLAPEFAPLPAAEVEAFRARRGLPGRFILYLGTLEPRKNLGALIRAFAQVARGQPDLYLVLAGAKGWLYADLFKLTQDLGLADRVFFPGFVPTEELPLWYNSATVFAYPSSYEGFGLPVIEALACGRPVVTSAVSSLPEAGGRAALLVSPEAPEALAEALARALTWGPAECALGLAQAAPFTWAATAAQTVRSYRRALGGEAGAHG